MISRYLPLWTRFKLYQIVNIEPPENMMSTVDRKLQYREFPPFSQIYQDELK